MARRLAAFVTVYDEHRSPKSFGPNDELPAWAERQITNAAAWVDDDEDEPNAGADPGQGGDADTGTGAGTEPVEAPPRNGPGSGAEHWIAFLRANGVGPDVIADDATRTDAIAVAEQRELIAPE
jgi:hypothetical protein